MKRKKKAQGAKYRATGAAKGAGLGSIHDAGGRKGVAIARENRRKRRNEGEVRVQGRARGGKRATDYGATLRSRTEHGLGRQKRRNKQGKPRSREEGLEDATYTHILGTQEFSMEVEAHGEKKRRE